MQTPPSCPNCQSTAVEKHDHDLRHQARGRDAYYTCNRCGNKFEVQ